MGFLLYSNSHLQETSMLKFWDYKQSLLAQKFSLHYSNKNFNFKTLTQTGNS